MIGKIIGIVFLLIVGYFAWDHFSDFKSTLLESYLDLTDQPAERTTAPYNAGRDIVLSRENPNIPNSPWNP